MLSFIPTEMSRQHPAFNTSTKSSSMTIRSQSKSLKETKKQTNKLEQENRYMEERLNDLKLLLNRDRLERTGNSASSANHIWGSSGSSTQSATTLSSAKPTLTNGMKLYSNSLYPVSGGSAPISKPKHFTQTNRENFPKRIKVLKDIPIDEPPKAPDQIMAFAKMLDRKPVLENYMRQSSELNPVCGFCEKKHVTVICVECENDFCSMCFAKMHLRGEPKKHKSIPYDPSKSTARNSRVFGDAASDNFTKDGIVFKNVENTSHLSTKVDSPQFENYFDEEASAASFQEALKDWRNAGKPSQSQESTRPKESKAVGVGDETSTTISTNQDDVISAIRFKDESSLSYAEKLLLKKLNQGDTRHGVLNSRQSDRPESRAQTERNGGLDSERDSIRETVSRYFTPRGAKAQENGNFELSEIEITELEDNELSFSNAEESTICSVMEPDFEGELHAPGLTGFQNSVTPVPENTISIRIPGQQEPASLKSTKHKPSSKQNSKGSKTPANNSAKKNNTSPKKNSKTPVSRAKTPRSTVDSRPTSALSITVESMTELSKIARRQKTNELYTCGLGDYFTLNRPISGDCDYSKRNREDSQVKNSNLITLRKSKAPWRPSSSRSTGQKIGETQINNANSSQIQVEHNFDFQQELTLLDTMHLVQESTRYELHTNKESTKLGIGNAVKEVNRILLDDEDSNEGDVDEQTLDDLEYELACNTGRLTADGQRVDRITQDLEGILNDLEMDADRDKTPVPGQAGDFELNLDAEMSQNYLSDEEDYPQSVRNL